MRPVKVMEQLDGYDYKADIWSLGITALELAKGMAPYASFAPMKVLLYTIQNDPPSLASYPDAKRDGVPFSRAFRDLVRMCLQKDPSKRPTCAKLLSHPLFTAKDPSPASLVACLLDKVGDVGGGGDGGRSGNSSHPDGVPPAELLGRSEGTGPVDVATLMPQVDAAVAAQAAADEHAAAAAAAAGGGGPSPPSDGAGGGGASSSSNSGSLNYGLEKEFGGEFGHGSSSHHGEAAAFNNDVTARAGSTDNSVSSPEPPESEYPAWSFGESPLREAAATAGIVLPSMATSAAASASASASSAAPPDDTRPPPPTTVDSSSSSSSSAPPPQGPNNPSGVLRGTGDSLGSSNDGGGGYASELPRDDGGNSGSSSGRRQQQSADDDDEQYAGPDSRADQDAFAAQMGGVELLSEEELSEGRQESADRRQMANDEVLDFIHQLGHEMGGEGMMGASDLAATTTSSSSSDSNGESGSGGVVAALIEASEAALEASSAAAASNAAETEEGGASSTDPPAEPAPL